MFRSSRTFKLTWTLMGGGGTCINSATSALSFSKDQWLNARSRRRRGRSPSNDRSASRGVDGPVPTLNLEKWQDILERKTWHSTQSGMFYFEICFKCEPVWSTSRRQRMSTCVNQSDFGRWLRQVRVLIYAVWVICHAHDERTILCR